MTATGSEALPEHPTTRNGPLLVVVTGPSGVGKDAVLNRMKVVNHRYHFAVTCTTRARRDGETDGVDYYFVTREAYDRMLAAGELLEHAEVYGHGYGIPRAPVRASLRTGRDVVLRIDPQGAATVMRLAPGAITIFIAPPNLAELERRLRERKTETPEALARRLAAARAEMERASEADYYVVNEDGRLDETVAAIEAIMTAERARIRRLRIEL